MIISPKLKTEGVGSNEKEQKGLGTGGTFDEYKNGRLRDYKKGRTIRKVNVVVTN